MNILAKCIANHLHIVYKYKDRDKQNTIQAGITADKKYKARSLALQRIAR